MRYVRTEAQEIFVAREWTWEGDRVVRFTESIEGLLPETEWTFDENGNVVRVAHTGEGSAIDITYDGSCFCEAPFVTVHTGLQRIVPTYRPCEAYRPPADEGLEPDAWWAI